MEKLSTYGLIKSDYFRYTGKGGNVLSMAWLAIKQHCFAYNVWLRLAASSCTLTSMVDRIGHRILSSRHGIQISRLCHIGKGFYIGHGVAIVVSPSAVIGSNCNISQMTTIGSNKGSAAVIGDNVWIGPGVSIVENVHIGDNASVGAGSIVVKDIPANATAVGNPAHVIHYNNPGQFIRNPFCP